MELERNIYKFKLELLAKYMKRKERKLTEYEEKKRESG